MILFEKFYIAFITVLLYTFLVFIIDTKIDLIKIDDLMNVCILYLLGDNFYGDIKKKMSIYQIISRNKYDKIRTTRTNS